MPGTTATANQTRRNHYVPRWYQRRFLENGRDHFFYLDLRPDKIKSANGTIYERNSILKWGPSRCFYHDDLYTISFGNWSSDQIEKLFFGPIDSNGQKAAKFFSDYSFREGVHDAFNALIPYMDAQRLRTPRGLDWLKKTIDLNNHSLVLIALRKIFQIHATMWTEGIWEIVSADESETKFLLTDNPVTFYNSSAFPGSQNCLYPNDVDLSALGTRTIFPLDLNRCLIISHIQYLRNPWANPSKSRTNARAYSPTMINLLDIQARRQLEEQEVLKINYIMKQRATRYIAASEHDWLYPENKIRKTLWSKLDEDWFLFPHLYKVPFSGGIAVGYRDGTSWAMDEYGRARNHPDYQDKQLHNLEWKMHLKAKIEWALKRKGKSNAHVDKRHFDSAGDSIMNQEVHNYESKKKPK